MILRPADRHVVNKHDGAIKAVGDLLIIHHDGFLLATSKIIHKPTGLQMILAFYRYGQQFSPSQG